MKKNEAVFIYNGIPSNVYGIRIKNEIVFPSPSYDFEEIQLKGHDGDLIYSNDRLESFILEFPCKIQLKGFEDIATISRDIHRWLSPSRGYNRLEFSALPYHYIKAIHIEEMSIAEQLRKYGEVTFKFKCYPAYFTKSGEHRVKLNNYDNIVNTNSRIAKPIWYISGVGNIEINVDSAIDGFEKNQKLIINDLKGSLILDSAELTANSPDTTEPWIWIRSFPFPVFGQGVNIVKINNPNITVHVEPRWAD